MASGCRAAGEDAGSCFAVIDVSDLRFASEDEPELGACNRGGRGGGGESRLGGMICRGGEGRGPAVA